MEVDETSPRRTVLDALESGNEGLVTSYLEKIAAPGPETPPVSQRIDEVMDFLDVIPRSNLDATLRARFHAQGVSCLCDLMHGSEPDVLRDRSELLLSYLISSLYLPIAQLPSALWLMWLANRTAAEQALREHGLTSRRSEVRIASLAELGRWVDAMKGRLAFRKFTPTVVKMLRDEDPATRRAAYALIVRYFASAKQPARDDLAEVMRRNQFNDVLREKIMLAIEKAGAEAGAEAGSAAESVPDPESLGDEPLTSVTRKERPADSLRSGQATAPLTASQKSSLTASHATSLLGRSKTELSVEPELAPPDVLRDPLYPMQPLEAMTVASDEEFLSEIGGRLGCFEGKETEHNWSTRQQAVQHYRRMLRSEKPLSPNAVRAGFKLLTRALGEVLLSMRTTLVADTCQAIKDTAHFLSRSASYAETFDPVIDPLAKVSCGIKKITAAIAHVTMCAVIIESPSVSARQFGVILQETKNLKPHARAYAFYWLNVAAATTPAPASLLRYRADVEQILARAVVDAAPAGRMQARELFWTLECRSPEITSSVARKLSPSALKALQASKPKGLRPSGPKSMSNLKVDVSAVRRATSMSALGSSVAPLRPHHSQSSAQMRAPLTPRKQQTVSGLRVLSSASSSSSSPSPELLSPRLRAMPSFRSSASPDTSGLHTPTYNIPHSAGAASPILSSVAGLERERAKEPTSLAREQRDETLFKSNLAEGESRDEKGSSEGVDFEEPIIPPRNRSGPKHLGKQHAIEERREGGAHLASSEEEHFVEEQPAGELAQSMADLSMHDEIAHPDAHDDARSSPIIGDNGELKIVVLAGSDSLEALRELARADLSEPSLRQALDVIKNTSPELSTLSAISRAIQQDLEGSSQEQRQCYLKLLRRLEYDEQQQASSASPAASRSSSGGASGVASGGSSGGASGGASGVGLGIGSSVSSGIGSSVGLSVGLPLAPIIDTPHELQEDPDTGRARTAHITTLASTPRMRPSRSMLNGARESPTPLPGSSSFASAQSSGRLHEPIVKFPTTRRTTHSTPIRNLVYTDNSSDGSDDSMLSAASSNTSSSSLPQACIDSKIAEGEFIDPFTSSIADCKARISRLVVGVRHGTCSTEGLAALTILVTAVTTGPQAPARGGEARGGEAALAAPLQTAINVWRQHFTYDMQLRDSILAYVSQAAEAVTVEQVIIGLVLLRALCGCAVPHAAVYLDPVDCVRALAHVSIHFSHLSLELEEHVLPDVCGVVLERAAQACTHNLLEQLGNTLRAASPHRGPQVFSLQATAKLLDVVSAAIDSDVRAALQEIVALGIENGDARVRKEVYPVLIALHRVDAGAAAEISQTLSEGQRQLFEYYIEATPLARAAC